VEKQFSLSSMRFLRLFCLLGLLALAGCSGLDQKGRYVAEDTSRTIDLTIPPLDAWERIRRGFAIPNLNTPLSAKWTAYYAAHPEAMQRMAERAGKYLYYIVDEINRRGLPTELALLPFVESAYNPVAYSSARASGLWQFIPSTGTQFKLKQDWWHDQRRDPIASTNAALDYLEYLFEFQGDWYLALASYNWGEGSVKRAVTNNMAKGKATDYLSLSMPNETLNYIPKLQAIKNIVADPERYAVVLPRVDNSPYFVTVQKKVNIDFTLAAQLAEMPLEDFQALNPSFNQPVISAQEQHVVILPRNKVDIFNANLLQYQGELSSWKTYEAKQGETFSSIAAKFGVAEARLRQANRIEPNARVAVDQIVIIPGPAGQGLQLAPPNTSSAPRVAGRQASSAPSEQVRLHVVRNGDSLGSIARQYNTTIINLRALNQLKTDKLQVGVKLRVPGTGKRS
jgi:membrane-bound lytic murein transglycosylase D